MAKSAIDNCRAGRAAKGANPSSCAKKSTSAEVLFLAQEEGFAPLAARPARQLSIADFAIMLSFIQSPQGKAFCSHKTAPTLKSHLTLVR